MRTHQLPTFHPHVDTRFCWIKRTLCSLGLLCVGNTFCRVTSPSGLSRAFICGLPCQRSWHIGRALTEVPRAQSFPRPAKNQHRARQCAAAFQGLRVQRFLGNSGRQQEPSAFRSHAWERHRIPSEHEARRLAKSGFGPFSQPCAPPSERVPTLDANSSGSPRLRMDREANGALIEAKLDDSN